MNFKTYWNWFKYYITAQLSQNDGPNLVSLGLKFSKTHYLRFYLRKFWMDYDPVLMIPNKVII